MHATNVIVNSDDLGKDTLINDAIVECFDKGLCSSTTIMATGPAYEEACTLIHERGLLNHVGLHLVLDEGTPLTDGIKRCLRLCDRDGRFLRRVNRLYMTADERLCVLQEMRAQIERVRHSGIPITHLDSHHHVHELWPILSAALEIAEEQRIPYVRLAVNCGPLGSTIVQAYRACVNYRIRRRGLARTRHFGSLANFLWHLERVDPEYRLSCEVMIHPIRRADGVIVDAQDPQTPLSLRLPEGLHATLVSYTGHTYGRQQAAAESCGPCSSFV